jgi:hypothetical protein
MSAAARGPSGRFDATSAWHAPCVWASGEEDAVMAIESAIFYLVALALPVWLVIEQLTRRGPQPRTAARRQAAPSTAAPARRRAA